MHDCASHIIPLRFQIKDEEGELKPSPGTPGSWAKRIYLRYATQPTSANYLLAIAACAGVLSYDTFYPIIKTILAIFPQSLP